MDTEILLAINQYAGHGGALDILVDFLRGPHFRTVPFMMLFWSLWFVAGEDVVERRDKLVTALVLLVPLIVIARLAAELLPFQHRPLHDPDVVVRLMEWQSKDELDGWSSMPSDHAAIFFALAVCYFFVRVWAGVVGLLIATFVVCLPRIYMAIHWPSDILVGAILGVSVVFLAFRPLLWLAQKTRIVPFFEARPALGYPLLFLVTYEVTQMFFLTRKVVEGYVL